MNPSVRQFRALTAHYLDETHRLFPHVASERGLHEYEALLGQNDAATHMEYQAVVEMALRAVEALPDFAFTGDDWLDRRGLIAMLRTERFFNGEFPHWRINPQVHCGTAIDSIFHLVIRYAGNLKAGREAIESRLAALPCFLEQGAACLRKPVPLWTKLARQSCDGARSFFESVGQQLAPISPKPAKTAELIRNAIAALQRYARVAESKAPGPANGFSVGRENFEFLIRERLGFSLSVEEAEALGLSLVEKLNADLKAEAKKFGKGKSVAAILEDAAKRWQPQAPLLEEYTRVTAETRGQFERADFVTFPPKEKCRVTPVPEYLKHQFPTAAYLQPGAFDSDQTGTFWVNDLSLDQPTPEKRAQEIRQHFGLALTCAHEAYPGHHLQFVVQNRHPSKIRRLMHHAIFYEGWTLWCEKQSVDLGIVDYPEARLTQIHDALWRAHRIVIDCGLHSGKLSYAAAAKRLQDGVGFTAARARGDVNWYTSSPTVPMSYLLGRLEVERLHAQLVGREGWSLKQFNDWMLSYGAIPWSWIWQSRLRPA
ncbi:MAG TPA: DUF885 domain-containing protein [Chthoniobacter sp.]|nr:DUF885 domain-containing protein [Chthoniobacter sp.]